jgi:hypothetical protein
VVGVLGHEVPGPMDPLAADLLAAQAGKLVVEPAIDAPRLERDGFLRPDESARGQAVAKADPRPRLIRKLKIRRGHPAAVSHDHRPAGQPLAVVDGRVRVTGLLDCRQIRPEHHASAERSRTDPQLPRDLGAERA